jgi:hypothetical protein
MVNFNVNPPETNNTPYILSPNDIVSWDNLIFNVYKEDGVTPETSYTTAYDRNSGNNIIISKTIYNENNGLWEIDPDNSMASFNYIFNADQISNDRISLLNIPYPFLTNFSLWQASAWPISKTWLFNNVARNMILIIGPVGSAGVENDFYSFTELPVEQKLEFSEDFVLLNDQSLMPLHTNTTITNNTITSTGGYFVLYFSGSYNKVTITPSVPDETIRSLFKWGILNKPFALGLGKNKKDYKPVTISINNNSSDIPLVTNPYPFDVPTIDYDQYDDKQFVTFNIYEKID